MRQRTSRRIALKRCRLWHIADKPTASALVAYWGNNGQRPILAEGRLSANNPQRALSVRRSSSVNAAGRPYAAPHLANS